MYLICLSLFLFISELYYFKLANRYNIIDKPNNRSIHVEITIRGGGIVFWMAMLIYFCYSNYAYYYFFVGLTVVAFISFIDDIYTLSNRFRLPIQFLAIWLVLLETNYFFEPYWIFGVLLIVGVGILNAYNFMDGINGITGGYSLVAISTFWYINNFVSAFIDNEFLYSIIASLLVFNYFNFRKKAKCFAGDVGSVGMGLIIVFLLLKLIALHNQYYYILILAVYGVDSVVTILLRIIKRENIFKAHNSHFFQVLARNMKLPHLHVSGIYISLQIVINLILMTMNSFTLKWQWLVSISILLTLCVLYLILKQKYLKLNTSTQ
jgi:UDP-GlcNAc:undecaprenyl-phosphate/decaprenyl-phosphate GlcNAc-1-phosphate transferase